MINVLLLSSVLFFNAHQERRDSIGTETINGKVFVLHSVGEKETLYGISRRYGASIESILQYNPTANAGLEIGQILKVPYTPKRGITTASSPASPSGQATHTVAAKETMYSISRLYGVTVEEIKQWNNLSDNALSIGQQLIIKKGNNSASTGVHPAAASSNKKGIHTVAAKETMFSISRQYGISVDQLKEWNNLETNELNIGQELFVSAQQTGAKQTAPVATQTAPPVQSPTPTQTTPTVSQSTQQPVTEAKPVAEAGFRRNKNCRKRRKT